MAPGDTWHTGDARMNWIEGLWTESPTLKGGIWEASKPAKRKLNSPMFFFLERKHKLVTM